MSSVSSDQHEVEQAWLALTHRIASASDGTCVCRPSDFGARWSGYLGDKFTNTRVLFVGANHNGGDKGLLKTPQMAIYNRLLVLWSSSCRCEEGDRDLLDTMREVYSTSWPLWGAVWQIFGFIRKTYGIGDDAFAFVNLARCPDPTHVEDNAAIKSCQMDFPLAELIEAIDARIIFIAKGGDVGESIQVPDAIELADVNQSSDISRRLVVRYDNGSFGGRGGEQWSVWIPGEKARITGFLDASRRGVSSDATFRTKDDDKDDAQQFAV